MVFNFVADSLHTKKIVLDFLKVKCNFRLKTTVLSIWAPFWGLRGNYDVYLRLIGKRMVEFLLVLIELFCKVLRISIENWSLRSNSQFDPKFKVEVVVPHQPLFLAEN